MSHDKTLLSKIGRRLQQSKGYVFLRKDFDDLSGYDQVGRSLRELVTQGKLIKIGYGLYAKTKKSSLTGQVVPMAPLPTLAKEALARLGIKTSPSRLEEDYQAGRTTHVPTGRLIAITGRVRRKIGYNGMLVHFERPAGK